MSLFSRKKTVVTEVQTPEELLQSLPKWCLAKSKPRQLFTKIKKDYIQVIILSKVLGSKSFWAELDGIGRIRTDKRAYRVPKENLYGNVYIYDIDNKKSITELINISKDDAEDSHKELQTANMYYMLGKLSGLNDFLSSLGTVTILLIVCLVASLIGLALTYSVTKDIVPLLHQIISMLPEKVETVVVP